MNLNNNLRRFILTLFILLSSSANAVDCKLSQEYFNKGIQAGKSESWPMVKKWLDKSIAECNLFDNWYLLGQAEFKLGNIQAASSAFEDARSIAKTNNQKALAIARYAEVKASQGEISRPLKLLHIARNLTTNTPNWITDLALKLDKKRLKQSLTVNAITESLKKTNRAIKLFQLNAKTSINVNIHFKYNSVVIVDSSIGSIDVLAEALSDDSFKGKNITIIGHSDSRGTDSYNYKLSERRAHKIVNTILAIKPELDGRLNIEGLGERAPLYIGATEDIYLLNRRIEVQLDD